MTWIKSRSFITHKHRQGILLVLERNGYMFALIALIAVQNGVVDCFGEADKNISLFAWGKVVAGSYIKNKWFDFGNLLRV